MPAVRVCSDQRDKSIQEQSGCRARPGCWQLQALWSEIHHLQQAACLDAFVWGQEIGEVIAPSWCSSSLLRLLAGKMKATPIISENTPNELSWASGVQLEPPPLPISSLNLYTLSMHDGTKRYCQFLFSLPRLSWWNETLVEIVCQSNWGHIQKHRSPSSQFGNCSSNNMVFSARKKKSECLGLWAHLLRSPPLCFQPLDCELKRFFFPFSTPASRGGTGDVEWWTGVQALCCSYFLVLLTEKYFDMKKVQCKEGLDIYKKFLTRMTRISEFLKVAEVSQDPGSANQWLQSGRASYRWVGYSFPPKFWWSDNLCSSCSKWELIEGTSQTCLR